MKKHPLCLILGFYSDAGVAESGYREIRVAGHVRACLVQGSGTRGWLRPKVCSRYSALRLDGESLVVAETAASQVEAIAAGLRRVGSPAVFVIRDHVPEETPPPPAAEPLSGERLREFARDLARQHGPPGKPRHRQHLLARLKKSEATIAAARTDLTQAARLDRTLTASAEWLLDNYYLTSTQAADVRRNLPRGHSRILPTLPSRADAIRVSELTRELVRHTDHILSEANIRDFLSEYQTVEPLTMAELWAFPILLGLTLIEELARLALRTSQAQQSRDAGYLWANRLATSVRQGEEVFQRILAQMEQEPVALHPHFVSCLAEQLQGEESALAPAQQWLEERLKVPLNELVSAEHVSEAAERVSIGNAFGSLRALAQLEFARIFETVSLVERELRTDPGGTYARSDAATRDHCRHTVELIARHGQLDELEVSRAALSMAAGAAEARMRHVAYYLLSDGIPQLEHHTRARLPARHRLVRTLRRHATPVYLSSVTALTACFLSITIALAWEMGVRSQVLLGTLGVLAVFPLSELAIQIVNALVISLLPPDQLPKMDFSTGVPVENATLVVIPMLLLSPDVVRNELEKLEVRYLGNQDANFWFSLFPDFTDWEEPAAPHDEPLLRAMEEGIDELNRRYPGDRFLLFHRQRVWSESEQRWIGRERKRGKLDELNAYLCGEHPDDLLIRGRLPETIRYVITLDADTQLPAGSARRMTETIAHPLNVVEIDPATGVRVRGFTIIQPRVSIALPGATVTRFTRVFANTRGTDPYCRAVSDAHQDLFGEAIFHGKAIYDVRAFRTILGNRFPAETLLSHDLIEGVHVGVGLASDIELFENLPLDYSSYSEREHRWIRGDWQIASWIFGHVPSYDGEPVPNPLTYFNRWRILDNLRRSLVPVASLLLLLFGWLISAAPGVWTLVVGLAVAIPAIVPLLERLAEHFQGSAAGWQGAADELVRAVVAATLLPHRAWLAVDAIVRVTYRRRVSRRNLLEWRTAEMAGARTRGRDSTFRQLMVISGVSAILLIALYLRGAIAPTSGFVALWLISPAVVTWLALPARPRNRRQLSAEDKTVLRVLARRTWRYFDDLVGSDTNWLPPDNSQLALRVEVAQRTSTTNIGLWLTSALAARDLGYLTLDDFITRCSLTMATVDRLERYEGHLLNWYNTRTLEPLNPRYVSTVDSGNLLASLWVLEQGCRDALSAPLLGQSSLLGLSDTVAALVEVTGTDASAAMPLRELGRLSRVGTEGQEILARLRVAQVPVTQLAETRGWQAPADDERTYWVSGLVRELAAWTATVDRYLPWMETLTHPPDSFLQTLDDDAIKLRRFALSATPSLQELATGSVKAVNSLLAFRTKPGLPSQTSAWLEQLGAQYERSQQNAAQTSEKLQVLEQHAARIAASIDMRFLYDKQARLFGIGYAVGGPLEFNSHYDLLASECRLASLVAIAKGDVPIEHWFAMGRPRVLSPGGSALLSWTGTMFEYLMPLLFTRSYANSLLDSACQQAVKLQEEYGARKGVPWGMSESAYSALDASQIYQYKAFGVPTLALKPGLDDDLVVSPYSTLLALPLDPAAAMANLERLVGLGLRGPMGLYESIDFTRDRTREGQRGVVVYTYMSHHQSMSLLALCNTLHENIMQERFHANLRIRAVESILFERVPVTRPPLKEIPAFRLPVRPTIDDEPAQRVWNEDTAVPRAYVQGNNRYALMITNSGGGYSRFNEFDLTRWRADTTTDAWGSFLYIRDLRSQSVWAATHHPTGGHLGISLVRFSSDRAEFQRRVAGIETVTEVTVAAEDDVELRRVTVTNRSLRGRQIELTSYAELVLAAHNADCAHPSFAKMFVETECLDGRILLARRRLRANDDAQVWAAHLIVGASGSVQYETDRREFLGRANSTASPDALRRNLKGSTGAVLDPIFSLRCRVALDPREQRELTFVTIAASSRDALLALVAKYSVRESVTRAFEVAWTRGQVEFRHLGIGPPGARRFQELASHLLYPNARLRPTEDRLARNRLGKSGLWAHGISGDLPILVVTIAEARNTGLIRELLCAHTYWRMRGFRVDFVILNQERPSYDRPLHGELERIIGAHSLYTGTDRPGGVFLRDWYTLPEEDRTLFFSAGSVVVHGSRGSLPQQLVLPAEPTAPPLFSRTGTELEQPSPPLPFLELPYFNGLGGFTRDGSEYAIYLKPGGQTPAPWVNVMAGPHFGTMVSESGLGFTWAGNSQSNRLTPWNNDPVSDPQSEILYIRDEDSGVVWNPTPLPIREEDAYRARHGLGYTVFEHNSHSIGQELTVFVPSGETVHDPVKICRLRLRNDSSYPRRLTVTYFAEWVLGSQREEQQAHVRTSWDAASGAVLARSSWNTPYPENVGFLASSPAATSHSGDRMQFIGRNASNARPMALQHARLDNRTGAGLDPAGIVQVSVRVDPGRQVDAVFMLGQAGSVEEVRTLVDRYRTPEQVEQALETTRRSWTDRLGIVKVHTPVASVDFLLNRWLPYQTLSCRFWGRSAFFQSGGAYGFRDQLQDSMALLYAMPELVREHILTCASRQFVEGDVQHWWHAETGLGTRTLCSDDLVWLPYVTARYVEVTGDTSILDQDVPFLEGPPLAPGEHEKGFIPLVSAQSAPLWEHCRRALEHAWRLGPHGLPLFGSGDWNDGMNEVGAAGRGESTWLAWFLCAVFKSFGPLIEKRNPTLAAQWRTKAADLASAVEAAGWDGEWYLRGFFDNGSPLGSSRDSEAKIDAIAQAWAVISGSGEPGRARQAMVSAERHLVRERDGLVLLLTPPFDRSLPHPGYIMGYPPGIRENGGQYTHGALWLAMALARLRDGNGAARLLQIMNPVERNRTPEQVARYRGEPYVVAADVYSAPGKVGQAGWTWYTGSSGWMYRIWLEEVLGFQLRGDTLTMDPVIPEDWPGFEITFRYRSATYEIVVLKDAKSTRVALQLDGRRLDTAFARLSDDGGLHRITVEIPATTAAAVAPVDTAVEVSR